MIPCPRVLPSQLFSACAESDGWFPMSRLGEINNNYLDVVVVVVEVATNKQQLYVVVV